MHIEVPETGGLSPCRNSDVEIRCCEAHLFAIAGTSYQPSASASRASMDLPSFPCAKLKLDQFFLQWLSEHQETVRSRSRHCVVMDLSMQCDRL